MLWPSGSYGLSDSHHGPRGHGSIPADAFIFLYYNNNCNHCISSEFHWIPMETVPGGSRTPTISTGFRWIPLEFPWNWKPEWLRLQPTVFRWNSNIPLRICQIPLELMEECKDLAQPIPGTATTSTIRPPHTSPLTGHVANGDVATRQRTTTSVVVHHGHHKHGTTSTQLTTCDR